MTLKVTDFENGAEGSSVTTGTESTVGLISLGTGGSILRRAAAALVGAFGARFTSGSAGGCLLRSRFAATSDQIAVTVAMRWSSNVAATAIDMRATGDVGQLSIRWFPSPSRVQVHNRAGTSVGTLLSGADPTKMYRYTVVADRAAGTASIKMYDGTTVVGSLNLTGQNLGTLPFYEVQIGLGTTSAGAVNDFDYLAIDDGATTEIGLPGAGGPVTGTVNAAAAVTAVVYAPTDPAGLGYVGDSLTYQGGPGNGDGGDVETTQATVGWDPARVRVDGLISREIYNTGVTPTTKTVIETWRANGFDPKTWILALGTNGSGDSLATHKTKINATLDVIAQGTTGVYRVYWVGLVWAAGNANTPHVAVFRQALAEVAAARTDLVLVPIDIEPLIHNGRDESALWSGTGPHMTTAGYALRNQLIAQATSALPAVTGTVTAAAVLTSSSLPRLAASGDVTAAGQLSGESFARLPATAAADATTAVTAASSARLEAAGQTVAIAAVSSVSTEQEQAAGLVAATATITASSYASGGTPEATGLVTATGSVTAASSAQYETIGSLTAAAAVSAAALVRQAVVGVVDAGASLTAATVIRALRTGDVSAAGTLTAQTIARHYLVGLVLASASAAASSSTQGPARDVMVLSITERPRRAVTANERPRRVVTLEERPQ